MREETLPVLSTQGQSEPLMTAVCGCVMAWLSWVSNLLLFDSTEAYVMDDINRFLTDY